MIFTFMSTDIVHKAGMTVMLLCTPLKTMNLQERGKKQTKKYRITR